MNAALILLFIVNLILLGLLLYTRQQEMKTSGEPNGLLAQLESARRQLEVERTVATHERQRANEWKQTAIDLSRRNHELTELLAKKVEATIIEEDGSDAQPVSVLQADREAAEARRARPLEHGRPINTRNDASVPPLPEPRYPNNDHEDDGA